MSRCSGAVRGSSRSEIRRSIEEPRERPLRGLSLPSANRKSSEDRGLSDGLYPKFTCGGEKRWDTAVGGVAWGTNGDVAMGLKPKRRVLGGENLPLAVWKVMGLLVSTSGRVVSPGWANCWILVMAAALTKVCGRLVEGAWGRTTSGTGGRLMGGEGGTEVLTTSLTSAVVTGKDSFGGEEKSVLISGVNFLLGLPFSKAPC